MIPAARPEIGDEERAAVDRVSALGMLAQGQEVGAFESEFSEVVDGRHCVAVNSGTSALHLAFLAGGVGPGDEVIVPSFSFAATAKRGPHRRDPGVRRHRDRLFRDRPGRGRSRDHSADQGDHAGASLRAPRQPRRPEKIADKHDLLLFEDAAQAHAASVDGIPVGAWGIAGSFSFYPTKNMTSGEGGMITTPSEELERMAKDAPESGHGTSLRERSDRIQHPT